MYTALNTMFLDLIYVIITFMLMNGSVQKVNLWHGKRKIEMNNVFNFDLRKVIIFRFGCDFTRVKSCHFRFFVGIFFYNFYQKWSLWSLSRKQLHKKLFDFKQTECKKSKKLNVRNIVVRMSCHLPHIPKSIWCSRHHTNNILCRPTAGFFLHWNVVGEGAITTCSQCRSVSVTWSS